MEVPAYPQSAKIFSADCRICSLVSVGRPLTDIDLPNGRYERKKVKFVFVQTKVDLITAGLHTAGNPMKTLAWVVWGLGCLLLVNNLAGLRKPRGRILRLFFCLI